MYESIENRYMVGLSSSKPETRAKFLQLFDSRNPEALPERLAVVIQADRWRLSSHRFWLKSALDMLFVRICRDDGILLAPQMAVAPLLLLPARSAKRGRDFAAGGAATRSSGGAAEGEGVPDGGQEAPRVKEAASAEAADVAAVGVQGGRRFRESVSEAAKVQRSTACCTEKKKVRVGKGACSAEGPVGM